MRSIAVACAALVLASTPASAQNAAASERARVVAALERLITTGEPRHTDHDEGEWLQAAVDAAIARGDVAVERLAQRAAVPLVARISAPVSRTGTAPALSFETPTVLTLPRPVSYRAELFVSVDGGESVRLGTHPGLLDTQKLLPQSAHASGLHRLSVTARITYSAGSNLPAETRHLPELAYAVYDLEARSPFDAGYVLDAAKGTNVRQLDATLPDERFELWLQSTVAAHGGAFDRWNDWTIQPCDARTLDQGLIPRSPHICATAWFMATKGAMGQAWIRTARLEIVRGVPLLLAEMPTFEGLTMNGGGFERLSALPELLEMPQTSWPNGDVLVAPEDITVKHLQGAIQVDVVVRNTGAVNVHGVEVFFGVTRDGSKGPRRSIVVDVPQRGDRSITVTLPFDQPYGAVVVHASQLSIHGPSEMWHPDPTPEDAIAFRIINPQLAPNRYAELLVSQCGFVCRGY